MCLFSNRSKSGQCSWLLFLVIYRLFQFSDNRVVASGTVFLKFSFDVLSSVLAVVQTVMSDITVRVV